jgi:hypothetical protein
MKSPSMLVLQALLRELERNASLRKEIDHQLMSEEGGSGNPGLSEQRRARNRRDSAVLDPYSLFPVGEEHLRAALSELNAEQLKDIISEYAMDSSRLALKWKVASRLIDFIVTTVRTRQEKGDAFRDEPPGSGT